jgi:hypothetical protein
MQSTPFASTGGVTAADIQSIKTRIDSLEKSIMSRFDLMQAASAPATTTSTAPSVSGLSQVLPTPSISSVDLASIFPKAGGARRSKRNKRNKSSRRYRKV